MKVKDWLLMLYIFKWAHFWVAPTWVFVMLWVLFIIYNVAEIVKSTIKARG